jgi:hypothetical protein
MGGTETTYTLQSGGSSTLVLSGSDTSGVTISNVSNAYSSDANNFTFDANLSGTNYSCSGTFSYSNSSYYTKISLTYLGVTLYELSGTVESDTNNIFWIKNDYNFFCDTNKDYGNFSMYNSYIKYDLDNVWYFSTTDTGTSLTGDDNASYSEDAAGDSCSFYLYTGTNSNWANWSNSIILGAIGGAYLTGQYVQNSNLGNISNDEIAACCALIINGMSCYKPLTN